MIDSFRRDSPTKRCSTARLLFLSKDSTLTNYSDFDVDVRLGQMATEFNTFKEVFEDTMSERKTFEDAIEMAKKRGMLLLLRRWEGRLVEC